jgi:hypothetical protein
VHDEGVSDWSTQTIDLGSWPRIRLTERSNNL